MIRVPSAIRTPAAARAAAPLASSSSRKGPTTALARSHLHFRRRPFQSPSSSRSLLSRLGGETTGRRQQGGSCFAEPENKNKQTKEQKDKALEQKEKLVKSLKATGIDQATAQKILKAWEGSGLADDPDKLRKLLLSRSLRSAGAILLQALIDAAAAYGAFSWGLLLDNPNAGIGDFPGKRIVQALSFFVTGYFIIGVLSDFFVLGALSFAAASYGANAGAVLDAVREVAGRPSGASALDKAAAAVNTLRVVAALNEIAELLKREVASGGSESSSPSSSSSPPSSSPSSSSSSSPTVSTLKTLSAILTLQRAEEKGFDPASLGLSRAEAAELATAFARFDANDDMVLQPSELEELCRSEGFELSSAEVAEAARLLDKNGDGLVSFPEFADWYVNKIKPPTVASK